MDFISVEIDGLVVDRRGHQKSNNVLSNDPVNALSKTISFLQAPVYGKCVTHQNFHV